MGIKAGKGVKATPRSNPSVKGTSCAKAQAAPYLDRYGSTATLTYEI